MIQFSFVTSPQRLKKFPKFYGTQRLITIFTRACRSVPILLHMNPAHGLHLRLELIRGLFLESTHQEHLTVFTASDTVHRYCCNYFWIIYLFLISSTCFWRCLRSSSGALDCIYSFCYCPPVLLLAGVMDEMERSSISSMTPASSNTGGQ